ncbi:MAG: hypothetical protein U0840_16860 [Gemmataceae bacterium]
MAWIDQDSIRPNTSTQQVTIGFKNKDDFKIEEVKKAIESKTSFKVGQVLKQP